MQSETTKNANLISQVVGETSSQHLPKDYAYVCRDMPESYYDYGQYSVKWGDPDNYSVIQQIGKGGYSEVYECINQVEEDESK